MISANTEAIQKSFTRQANNFETKAMSFTNQEYLGQYRGQFFVSRRNLFFNPRKALFVFFNLILQTAFLFGGTATLATEKIVKACILHMLVKFIL